MRAARMLDQVQNVAGLERFDVAAFAAVAGEELPAAGTTLDELGAQLDALRGLVMEIDRFTQKSMRVRLTATLDLPRQLHGLLHTTVISYEGRLELLRERLGPSLGGDVDRVMDMGAGVLATRAALRQEISGLFPELAARWAPVVRRAIRDRSLPDELRARWKRAEVDLATPTLANLEAAPFAQRLDQIPTPDDPPDDERPHRFELIEID